MSVAEGYDALGKRAGGLAVFAPTLSSQGGYLALQGQLGDRSASIGLAVVGDEAAFRRALPGVDAEVVEVSGHLAGARALRRHVRASGPMEVIAVQNPVIPIVPLRSSLLQNHLFVTPWSAIRLHPDPRDWPWLLVGAVGTAAQVACSAETVVLNPAYPAYWRRWSRVRIAPNTLGADSLGVRPQQERAPVVAVVTSFYRFRGLHVAIEGFVASGLLSRGWQMVIHAARGNPRYEHRCRRLAADSPGVRFAADDESPRVTLSSAGLACFPSRIEGSSIAFLEALLLEPGLIAFDGPHFRHAAGAAAHPPSIEWVANWDPAAWGAGLSSAAAASAVLPR